LWLARPSAGSAKSAIVIIVIKVKVIKVKEISSSNVDPCHPASSRHDHQAQQ
jgi:hypothetical protein